MQRDNMIAWYHDNNSTVTHAPTATITSRQPARRHLTYSKFGGYTVIKSLEGKSIAGTPK